MSAMHLPCRSFTAAFIAIQVLCIAPARAEESALERAAHPGKVQTTDQQVGTGRAIASGAFAVLHYTAWLYDPDAPAHKGKQFASSDSLGKSLTFVYGYKRVLPGLEKGLAGMRVGGRRTIVVPPNLAYDGLKYPRPADVPPEAALLFEVELVDVVPQSAPPDQ
jgi:FKBP-type peptidyl-prolyl cis-trans isomerase FkpA